MTNPFDDDSGIFRVLVNDEGEHSLWPDIAAIPAGWHVVAGPDTRRACVDYVENHWLDMRPKSLLAALQNTSTEIPS